MDLCFWKTLGKTLPYFSFLIHTIWSYVHISLWHVSRTFKGASLSSSEIASTACGALVGDVNIIRDFIWKIWFQFATSIPFLNFITPNANVLKVCPLLSDSLICFLRRPYATANSSNVSFLRCNGFAEKQKHNCFQEHNLLVSNYLPNFSLIPSAYETRLPIFHWQSEQTLSWISQ